MSGFESAGLLAGLDVGWSGLPALLAAVLPLPLAAMIARPGHDARNYRRKGLY